VAPYKVVIHMSKTDKTDPYWVKCLKYGTEVHNHIDGECRFEDVNVLMMNWRARPWPAAPCELLAGYRGRRYMTDASLWARAGRVKEIAGFDEAKARNKLRGLLKSDCIEDVDVVPFRHRHNACWEVN
jgi:hypothetical protein